MSFPAQLRCLRRSFLRLRSHARARRWSRRAAAASRIFVTPSVRSRSAALGSIGVALAAGLRARISVALSKSRLARARATTSGDALPPRLSRTLVSIALVASGRADCRSSTASASATAAASAAARASPCALFSAALASFCKRRLSLVRVGASRSGGLVGCFSTVAHSTGFARYKSPSSCPMMQTCSSPSGSAKNATRRRQ